MPLLYHYYAVKSINEILIFHLLPKRNFLLNNKFFESRQQQTYNPITCHVILDKNYDKTYDKFNEN